MSANTAIQTVVVSNPTGLSHCPSIRSKYGSSPMNSSLSWPFFTPQTHSAPSPPTPDAPHSPDEAPPAAPPAPGPSTPKSCAVAGSGDDFDLPPDVPAHLTTAVGLGDVLLVPALLEPGPVLRQHIRLDHRGVVLQQAQRAAQPHTVGDQVIGDLDAQFGQLVAPKLPEGLFHGQAGSRGGSSGRCRWERRSPCRRPSPRPRRSGSTAPGPR